ncbi:exo-alpha-sialidase [Fibrella sp. HMF5335]|uniref:Exo-alpha-sialidase n=1 Tax=Fibrella rubiginis TaxID=2817060 RepID=A0A939GC17_9BACT|nr:exo-alpha-sialidase [Fibrella rubiginis]
MPVVIADERGGIHLTFGNDSTIFYAFSADGGQTFTAPAVAGVLPNLVAGATRGPQIAVTDRYLLITAVDKAGNVFACRRNRATGQWSPLRPINDVPEVAKEGFQDVVGTADGAFHAVWLDLRGNQKNKLVGATSTDGGQTWSANRIIYQSPSGSVCECCRLSMAASGNNIYVMFRNWLNGSRDLYLAHSADAGKTYTTPQKLGNGTWKLAACPMDGGGLALTKTGKPITVWRREGTVYQASPGEAEQAISAGKNGSIASSVGRPVLAWETAGTIYVKQPDKPAVVLGTGQLPRLAVAGQTAVVVWENKGQVQSATLAM